MKINLSVAAVLLSVTFSAPVALAARADVQTPAKSSTVERRADLNAGVFTEEFLICLKEQHGAGLGAFGTCLNAVVANGARSTSSDKR